MAGRDLESLAKAVFEARNGLRLTQEEFAERGELGLKTVQRIEGRKVAPRGNTLAGLDKAARWPDGTARAIYYKEIPRPPSQTAPRQYVDPETGEPDREAILMRMVELLPSIRKHYGDKQADAMVGRIMDLAIQANSVHLITTQISQQNTDSERAG